MLLNDDPDSPQVTTVCVYPVMVKYAARHFSGTAIKVASVITVFFPGQASLRMRFTEVKASVADGPDVIDMVY